MPCLRDEMRLQLPDEENACLHSLGFFTKLHCCLSWKTVFGRNGLGGNANANWIPITHDNIAVSTRGSCGSSSDHVRT